MPSLSSCNQPTVIYTWDNKRRNWKVPPIYRSAWIYTSPSSSIYYCYAGRHVGIPFPFTYPPRTAISSQTGFILYIYLALLSIYPPIPMGDSFYIDEAGFTYADFIPEIQYDPVSSNFEYNYISTVVRSIGLFMRKTPGLKNLQALTHSHRPLRIIWTPWSSILWQASPDRMIHPAFPVLVQWITYLSPITPHLMSWLSLSIWIQIAHSNRSRTHQICQ